MELPAEVTHEDFWETDDVAEFEAGWEAAIQARVHGIRNGTGDWPDLREILAEMDQGRRSRSKKIWTIGRTTRIPRKPTKHGPRRSSGA